MKTADLITKRIFFIILAVFLLLGAVAGCSRQPTANYVTIATGNYCTIAQKSDGTVWAWGYLFSLGFGDRKHRAPVQISGLDDVIACAIGNRHFVALKADGTVWAQGANDRGQLGNYSNVEYGIGMNQVHGLTDIVAIAVEGNHNIALKSDGTVWGWGENLCDQFGKGVLYQCRTPVQIQGFADIVAIATGKNYTLAIKSDGTLWLSGYYYQYYQGEYAQSGHWFHNSTTSAIQVEDMTNIAAISIGAWDTYAIKSDGTVWAWNSGRGAANAYITRDQPVQIRELTSITSIATNSDHTIALKSDGTVWGWEKVYNTNDAEATPMQISGLTNIVAISVGFNHTVCMDANGTAWAWGRNENGQRPKL